MVTLYTGTYEIETKLFRTRRDFQFRSLEARLEFERLAATIGVKRVATNLEHVMTAQEAFDELVEEKLRCDDIALGRVGL